MKLLVLFFLSPIVLLVIQENETIYSINRGITTNDVRPYHAIEWGECKEYPQSSYIRIKKKMDGSYYINTVVAGQFAYGHFFRYIGKTDGEYKYSKTDGGQDDYIFVNYPLSELATSNKYDEQIVFKLVNYRTSFALLLEF